MITELQAVQQGLVDLFNFEYDEVDSPNDVNAAIESLSIWQVARLKQYTEKLMT